MKKLTLTLALILCLVLCVCAFASCGKDKKSDATTAKPAGAATTATPTEPAVTTAEPTQPTCQHVPEEDYFIETPATCIAPGSKVKLCAECGDPIEETREVIPQDPEAHKVTDWVTVEPTLLDPVGSQSGTCTLCDAAVNKVLNWELEVYDSMEPSGKYADGNAFRYNKKFGDIRGEKSFAPTEDDADGNDLWFEYSFLWNDSLQYRDNPSNLAEIRIFGFRDTVDWSIYRGFYYLYLLDDDDKGGPFNTSGDCPWKGHIDFSTYYLYSTPGQNCADDLGGVDTLNGKPIGRYIAGWGAGRDDSPYLYDDNYQTLGGWHRLGYRYHQEVASVEGSTVSYAGYTELYIDGVLCWRVHSNFDPTHKDSLVPKNLLLWTATAEDGVITGYTNNDTVAVEFRIDNITSSSQSVYICVDDFQTNCGDGFVHPVVRVENPTETTITLAEGVTASGAMYFAKAPVD